MGKGKGPTKNNLNQQFVFINKDAKSKSLTSSDGSEKQTIYGHVRRHMVKPLPQDDQQAVDRDSVLTANEVDQSRRRKRDGLKASNNRTIKSSNQGALDQIVVRPKGMTAAQTMELLPQDSTIAVSTPVLSMVKELETTPYARSFLYFRQMTIAESTGFHDVSFWNTSLQLSTSIPAVFHALTSLGALYESLISPSRTSQQETRRTSSTHFSLAVKETIEAGDKMPLPLLLMTCVIFATMQIFAEAETAQKTLLTGLNMALDAKQKGKTFSSSEATIIEMTTRMLERYQNRLKLVLGPLSIVREHTAGEAPLMIPSIPVSFESLLEARWNLQQICDWSFRVNKIEESRVSADFLHHQWLHAMDRFTQSSGGLHPLSTRSLNLLKIERLTSACFTAALFQSQASDYHGCFPTFTRLLALYRDSFHLLGSSTIFTQVFEVDDSISAILAKGSYGDSTPPSQQGVLKSQPSGGAFWNDFFFGSSEGQNDQAQVDTGIQPSRSILRMLSFDLFTRKGDARLRLKAPGQSQVIHEEVSLFHVNQVPNTSGP